MMIPGLPFGVFRWTILSLTVLSQIYLFFLARRAIRSSRRSARFKDRAVIAVGAMFVLIFAVNLLILYRPIPWVYPPTAAQVGLFYPPAVWGIGSILSALLLLVAQLFGRLAQPILRIVRNLSGRREVPPFNDGRRLFLQAGAGGLFAAPLLLSGYGATFAGRCEEVRETGLPFGCPLRIVQLTDIHAGLYMNREQMRRYVDRVNALQPDLFALTGDYISNSIAFLPGCLEEMARVHARYGTLAVLGNHEHWNADLDELKAIFRRRGVPLLQNEHRVVRTGRGPFAVAGIDDLRNGKPDLDAALRGIDEAVPTILLCHRPEIFPQAAAQGISLTLSGHYHGGQIKLGMRGAGVCLAQLRTPYVGGLYRSGSSRLYVSAGIGTTFTPVRLNAPPEITLLNLT
ncbi:MAG: metallophosphoesterase [Deltaproteobacteria bacterium]|nr:metallophosphoesterase [Deltaproteobacteria bacterium]